MCRRRPGALANRRFFGIAKHIERGSTRNTGAGEVLGTPRLQQIEPRSGADPGTSNLRTDLGNTGRAAF